MRLFAFHAKRSRHPVAAAEFPRCIGKSMPRILQQAQLQRLEELRHQHYVAAAFFADFGTNSSKLAASERFRTALVSNPWRSPRAILDASYHDLLQLDFASEHWETGKKVYSTLFSGTVGALDSIPLQIRYQPNWWFQVVLNYRPPIARSVVTIAAL